MRLFGVEDRKSYIKSTAQFKRGVLDVAISEINEFTELEVFYTEEKKGRAIVGFDLIWSTGVMQSSALKKQIKELNKIIDIVLVDSFKFIDLDDGDNRRRAMKIIEEMKEMSGYTTEPIQITGKKADDLMFRANLNLRKLNSMLQKENRDTSFYYNWLEE